MSHHHEPKPEPEVIVVEDLGEIELLRAIVHELREIRRELAPKTPTHIDFKENTMLDAVAGNTLVYTGTLSPAGTSFPANTLFTATSNYPNVSPTVDATGLVVTIPLPADFVDDPANPFSVTYSAGTWVPNPSTGPSALSATITPSAPIAALTPTAIAFAQTT